MPRIFLTNDDGFFAPGIHAAAKALSRIGEVTMVAPEKQQSAVSQKITLHKPLRINPHPEWTDYQVYSISGTPADCVKLGLHRFFPTERPDLLVSGINQGSNTGFNLFYSGTVAAAIEGMLSDIPSIAISLASYEYRDFAAASEILVDISAKVIQHGLDANTFLNINVPGLDAANIEGQVVCQVSRNRFTEEFHERQDPKGRSYYWMGGRKLELDGDDPVDDVVIRQNKVAIAPVFFDFQRDDLLARYRSWLTQTETVNE